MIDIELLNKKTNLVKEDIQKRYKGCSSTTIITMWDDDTFSVRCTHGTINGEKLCVSMYDDNKLTYSEIDVRKRGNMMYDAEGNVYLRI